MTISRVEPNSKDPGSGEAGRASSDSPDSLRPVAPLRTTIAGVLMGLANLVPGVSGGTMILVMGLYDDFVTGVADVTRLRFTKRHFFFLGIIGIAAAAAIGFFAGPLKALYEEHPSGMKALFVGMTLGGAPLLYRMITPVRLSSVVGAALGLSLMIAIALNHREKPSGNEGGGEAIAVEVSYGRDFLAGVLGISAMVLPGVSGAYMLLILGRWTAILGAIDQVKASVASMGREGEFVASLHIVLPLGLGMLVGIVALSNFLKWMLHHRQRPTIGFLLGILLGSVVGIWPFRGMAEPGAPAYATAAVLAIVGFGSTVLLSRIKA